MNLPDYMAWPDAPPVVTEAHCTLRDGYQWQVFRPATREQLEAMVAGLASADLVRPWDVDKLVLTSVAIDVRKAPPAGTDPDDEALIVGVLEVPTCTYAELLAMLRALGPITDAEALATDLGPL